MTGKNTGDAIQYVLNQQVDRRKWDACILSSAQPLIYALSLYLDGMCRHWDALIFGDYIAVMPLPWNKKWLTSYIYSPYFVVAGGVFAKEVSEELVSIFLEAIPERFRYIDLDLNEHNYFPSLYSRENICYQKRRNTFLHLNHSYEVLYSGFSSGAKRKLKKATGYHFTLDKSKQADKIIELYKRYYRLQDTVVTKFDFSDMIALLNGRLAEKTKTYILSFPDGEMAAFYLLLFDDNYVYWLIGGSTERGKEASAFYHLTSVVIQDFAGTERVFRFEGSDHEGIHFFNHQFGGETVYYPRIQINRLPWPFRYLK